MKVKIECEVSVDIFDEMPIKGRLEGILIRFADEVFARYETIMAFLNEHKLENSDMLSWEYVSGLFVGYVKKQLLNEAVVYTLQTTSKYDLMDNLMNIFTDDKFRMYMMGSPMIDAFSQAIRSLPNATAWDATLHGSKILLLRKEFLGKQYY